MEAYYRLTKPGIVYGNAMTALAAFVFASNGRIDGSLLFLMLIGLSASIAAACVVNNIIDRDIDALMERTKTRAMPTGAIPVAHALLYAFFLLGVGVLALLHTNALAFLATAIGVVVYVGIYTPLKRRSVHSTIVGAVAGAMPPVVGYVAVTDSFDTTALCLFLVLVTWQMTHFFAIAVMRLPEYRNAGIPVMPVALGVSRTKPAMLVYCVLFAGALYALFLTAHVGMLFAWTLAPLALGWIALSSTGLRTSDDRAWARRMFFYSIIVLLVFSIALALS